MEMVYTEDARTDVVTQIYDPSMLAVHGKLEMHSIPNRIPVERAFLRGKRHLAP